MPVSTFKVPPLIPIREVVELRDSDLRVCAHFSFFSLKFYGASVMSLVETGCCWMQTETKRDMRQKHDAELDNQYPQAVIGKSVTFFYYQNQNCFKSLKIETIIVHCRQIYKGWARKPVYRQSSTYIELYRYTGLNAHPLF